MVRHNPCHWKSRDSELICDSVFIYLLIIKPTSSLQLLSLKYVGAPVQPCTNGSLVQLGVSGVVGPFSFFFSFPFFQSPSTLVV